MPTDAIPLPESSLFRSANQANLVFLRGAPPTEEVDVDVAGPLASLGYEEWSALCDDIERWLASGESQPAAS
jgi:hypothetical protein